MDRQPLNYENKTEEPSEANMKKMAEEIIQKWLLLQKTVKEEITLEEIITKQQLNDNEKLKEYFREFYDLKIKSRKTYEDIKNLKTDNSQNVEKREYKIDPKVDKALIGVDVPVTNLLFLLRNNYDYIVKLISSINYSHEKEDKVKIESLVELLCNQFYDNILIPNPEQEELLILIYKLLEEEITSMNSASIDEFMHDSTFLGKFISSFMKRPELNVFLSILLNPIIASIENEDDGCLDMSLFSIQNFCKKEAKGKKKDEKGKTFPKTEKKKEEIVTDESIFKNIPKTKIKFKKNLQIEAERAEENRRENYEMDTPETPPPLSLILKNSSGENEDDKIEFNEEYEDELSQEKLSKKFKESKENKDLRDFYLHQLEQFNNDPNIFSNNGLLEVLNEQCFQNDKNQIMTKYKKNFLFIQKKVDTIIQALIDKTTSIPYTVRCISKIISLLISKKFPLLSKYLQNAFIGKFIFNKCIFPVLSLENKNAIENIIFSLDTKKCLNVIISVLSTANKCILFNCNTDTEKTIFNYYLIEIIPILNKFYEKLIDIELPKTLNDLVSKTKDRMEENNNNKLFSFRRKQAFSTPTQEESSKQYSQKYSATPLYDYFSENSDEIMNLQSICFSINDIIFILDLIKENFENFRGLPKFDYFEKTFVWIKSQEYKLGDVLEEDNNKLKIRRFFVVFKEEKNSQIEKLFRQKNILIDESNTKECDLIRLKIKDCIKKIFKGLNVLNIKDYSYLNMATSNQKFFEAIHYTLEDLFEFSENENDIPLKWYGQFIVNNIQSLDSYYLENDFEKLYEELYNEETNILNELKSYSSILITRDGMNLRCAEKIIEKSKSDLRRIFKAKKLQKIETYIEKEKLAVCIKIKEKEDGKNDKDKIGIKGFFGKKEGKNAPFSYISVVDQNICPHKNMAFIASMEGEKKIKSSTHAETVNEFIMRFKDPLNDAKKLELKTLSKFIAEDIKSGEASHEVYKAFNDYKELIKEKIKNNEKYIESKNENDLKIELNEFTDKIEEHIMRKIYKYVYPKVPLKEDYEFYKRTRLLDWITPEHLEIKKLFRNQLGLAIKWIKKMDEANSVMEKLRCIQNAQKNVNNLIKFSSGKDKNAGQDETTPIFQYILIRAHPKRIISNLNYISCFFDRISGGQNAFLLTNMQSFITFIENVTPDQLNMTKEEYDKKIKEATDRFENRE